MKFSVRFFSSLYISLLCTSVSNSVLATQTEKPERWFEIEVILFKQLGDKKALKEQFPDTVSSKTLPKYKKHFDLLTPYLQPSLTNIKQFIPLCGKSDTPHVFLESLQRINTPFLDAIKAIEHVDSFDIPKFTTQDKEVVQQDNTVKNITQSNTAFDSSAIEKVEQQTPENLLEKSPKNLLENLPENNSDSLIVDQQIEFVFDLQKEVLASPLFSTQNICIISRKDIKKLFDDEQLANFQLDAFDVEALPGKLNASGAHIHNSPYLIADESLLLTDIKQRLRWSKEFKPLLHFGWRQIGVTRNKAIPLKLFAGKHLDYQYQQVLNDYQHELGEAKQAEQLVFQQLNIAGLQESDSATVQIEQENKNNYAEIKQQQLTQLFNDINTVDSTNIDSLIGELELQTFEELVVINEVAMEDTEQLNIKTPPIAPLQAWFLDGFFKVHLDHYLYITADFNILGQSLDKSTNNDTDKTNIKLINFSQNKRVITGEIHYFDHPYIGMIVQIRRFDPSKSKEDAVTQVIN